MINYKIYFQNFINKILLLKNLIKIYKIYLILKNNYNNLI